ncbi:MAG: tryptophan--tRNA ligase, partial [Pseudomonadota bacterium]
TKEEVLAEHGGAQFSAFKPQLAELAVSVLEPVNAEMRRLVADPGHLDSVLADGGERASAIAEPILEDVKSVVGFVR